ncbi:hypothetical protein [Allokutzneria oryzae]|uniref:DUF1542 domain-containing protein n=1 Tax=Allokutzneria oryzae TaxID=1378989 RepID=A0ABV6A846_9PSEU
MSIVLVLLVIAVVGGLVMLSRQRAAAQRRELEDAKAEARRWVERLGGQVINLVGTNEAAKQALADASERYTAAGSQMEQASSAAQCKLATQTAMEGLYYVRAARSAMDMDPGPELPDLNGQRHAGAVSEDRDVEVQGHAYAASPHPGQRTPHYYPGGMVAGRPVPQGWYSEPWWKPALVAGAWGVGSALLFGAMFSGMAGVAAASAIGDFGADSFGDMGDMGDMGMDSIGDFGGGDFGGDMDFDF